MNGEFGNGSSWVRRATINPYIAFADMLLTLFVASLSINLAKNKQPWEEPKAAMEAALRVENLDQFVIDNDVRENGVTRLIAVKEIDEAVVRRLRDFLLKNRLQWRRLRVESHAGGTDIGLSREAAYQRLADWMALFEDTYFANRAPFAIQGNSAPRLKQVTSIDQMRTQWTPEVREKYGSSIEELVAREQTSGAESFLVTLAGVPVIAVEPEGRPRVLDDLEYPNSGRERLAKLFPCEDLASCIRLNDRVEVIIEYDNSYESSNADR